MTWICITALWSHWRRSPLQLFTFLAGLALATALWAGVQAINSEARASYDTAAATLGEGQFDQLVPTAGTRIPQGTFVALRRAGWLVSPVIEGRKGDLRYLGIEALSAPGTMAATLTATNTDAVDPAQVVFVNAETAAQLPPGLDHIVDPNVAPGMVIGDIGRIQTLLDRSDLSRLIVLPKQPRVQGDRTEIAPNLRLQAAQQTSDIAQLTNSFHLNLTAFGLLSFAVGLFIVHSTIGLAFEQRRGMIRTLRSLGVPLKTLVFLIAVEMMTLALIAACLGIALGYIIAALLLPDVAATLRGLYGAEVTGTLQLRREWWLSGLLIAMLGTAVALSGRLWQVARMPLLASVRPRAWAMAGGVWARFQAGAALALLALACVLAWVGDGLIAGFILLGAMLVGAALLLPVIARLVLDALQRLARAPIAQWFWADTRQQLPGLSLALMSLLLAISANIGVATMVSSFRVTFVSFLDQRLSSELYVDASGLAADAGLEPFLQANADETLPLLSVQTTLADLPIEMFGVRVGPTYRQNWVFLDATATPWDDLAADAGVIVNEQWARRTDSWVGDPVTVPDGPTLPIAAVVGDYGNPLGQLFVSEPLFQSLHPDIRPTRFGVRTTDPTRLRATLVDRFGLPQSAIIDQAALKSLSLSIFERTFGVTAALNILTLTVASFAILMSLLTLADLRVPQLAPVWALGMTRRRLGALELLRASAFSVLVFLCAVPLGLALAWVLLAIVNVAAFGWRLPMYLFPGDYIRLGGYAVLAAVLAAAWPAWRLMRTPPSALLKVFANER